MSLHIYNEAHEAGAASDRLMIREESDGCGWITLIKAKSRRELGRLVKARNWRQDTGCGTDCTGRVFSASCELLRAYSVNGSWVAVVYCFEARDV